MTLDQQREDYKSRRFLAMPLAGTVAWTLIGIGSLFLSSTSMVWLTFIATGCIVYLGIMFSKFTGENFTDKTKPKNTFDTLFFYTVGMSLLVYAIAIPFFMIDYTTLPFTVGVLAGLMWLPMSWIIQHWIGVFHTISRTLLLVAVYFLFPEQRFLASAIVVVIIYVMTMIVLEKRWKAINQVKLSFN